MTGKWELNLDVSISLTVTYMKPESQHQHGYNLQNATREVRRISEIILHNLETLPLDDNK